MDKKKILIGIIILILGITIWAYFKFKPTTSHLQLIPKDAAIIVSCNLKQLYDKANDGSPLKDSKFLKDFFLHRDSSSPKLLNIKKVLESPLNSGINFLSKVYAYAEQTKDSNCIAGLVIAVNDEDKLTKILTENIKDKTLIKQHKNYHYFQYGSRTIIAWNKTGLVLYSHIKYPDTYLENNELEIESTIDKYLNRDIQQSILSNVEFLNFDKQNTDVYAFINNYEFYNLIGHQTQNDTIAAFVKNELNYQKDLFTLMSLNFESNNILFNSQTIGKSKYLDSFKYFNDKGIMNDSINYYASKPNNLGFMSLNLNINKCFATLQYFPELRQKLEILLQKTKVTENNFKEMLTGEMCLNYAGIFNYKEHFMVSKFDEENFDYKQVDSIKITKIPKATLSLGISNRNNFDKITSQIFSKNNKLPYGINFFNYNNGITISNDIITSENILQPKINNAIAGDFRKYSLYFYIDLNASHYPIEIENYFKSKSNENNFLNFKNYLSIFENMIGSNTKNNFTLELKLTSGNGNSLNRMIKQMDTLQF